MRQIEPPVCPEVWIPLALGAFWPTAWNRSSELDRNHPTSSESSPPLYSVVVPARAAYSHSASVGSRYPSAERSQSTPSGARRELGSPISYAGRSPSARDRALQNSMASSQLMHVTGRSWPTIQSRIS
jgi:hypothetical protein